MRIKRKRGVDPSVVVVVRLTHEFILHYFYALIKLPFSDIYMNIFFISLISRLLLVVST